MAKLSSFEQKLFSGINDIIDLFSISKIGIAVSGGADSVSLLVGLWNIKKYLLEIGKNLEIYAITVNHNIRPEKETCGDADYVENLCSNLNIPCTRIDVPKGDVFVFSNENKCGIEAAARIIRYKAFDSFIKNNDLDYLCLAHNKNDQIETVLMRFLQGSGTGELSGIPKIRGKYIRPLMDISRSEIEDYLFEKNISFKYDSTNDDVALVRNSIRKEIIPFINEKFPGWTKATLNLSKKSSEDEDFIQSFIFESCNKCDFTQSENGVSFDLRNFLSLYPAIKRRILYKAFDSCGIGSGIRISYAFLMQISDLLQSNKSFSTSGMGFEISCDGKRVFIRMLNAVATERSFFVIIEEDGTYEAAGWEIICKKHSKVGVSLNISNESFKINNYECELDQVSYPFAFRSKEPADFIKCANGSCKSVSKIYKDWKVDDIKSSIPVIQSLGSDEQELVAILGKMFGYSNWVVSN